MKKNTEEVIKEIINREVTLADKESRVAQLLKLFNETVLSVIGEEEEGKPFYWKEDHEEKVVLFARNMLRAEQRQKLKEII